jgi:hypothetical protein
MIKSGPVVVCKKPDIFCAIVIKRLLSDLSRAKKYDGFVLLQNYHLLKIDFHSTLL